MIQKWPQLKQSKECVGVFAKSEKVTISFMMLSIHLRVINSAPTAQIFVKFDIQDIY